jgi:hypothetical protein
MSFRSIMMFGLSHKIKFLIDAFKTRVLGDSGVFEAEDCTHTQLTSIDNKELLDSASLVITPNGYKTGKLYSVIPSDGSGDMDVTRATTATRVNEQGLIERVPYNLLQQSEDFTVSPWLLLGVPSVTRIANAGTSPTGTNNATLLTSNSTNIFGIRQSLTISPNTQCVFSCWVRSNTPTQIQVDISDLNITSFNLTNTWQRIQVLGTYNNSYTATTQFVDIAFGPNQLGSSFFIWGAQLVEGTEPKDYYPTTTGLNIPRLDYSNGSCPSILVEPQRTNLLLRSEEFSDASWLNTNLTITNNSTISPNGSLNADTLIATVTNAQHSVQQNINISTTSDLTFSCYVKNNGGNFVQLVAGAISFSISNPYQNFNLQTGTLAQGNIPNSTIKNVGNGWYKITMTVTNSTTGVGAFFIIPILNGTTARVASFAGDGINGVYVWGAQLEVGANATSYIPTVASAVTRNADVISKTGVSDLIGQTEGTLYAEFNTGSSNTNSGVRMILSISDGTNNNRIEIYIFNNNLLYYDNVVSGLVQYSGLVTTITSFNTNMKIALSYKLNSVKFFINGSLLNTDLTALVPICSQLNLGSSRLGSSQYNGSISDVLIFKTQLSDTQCIQLTTL